MSPRSNDAVRNGGGRVGGWGVLARSDDTKAEGRCECHRGQQAPWGAREMLEASQPSVSFSDFAVSRDFETSEQALGMVSACAFLVSFTPHCGCEFIH